MRFSLIILIGLFLGSCAKKPMIKQVHEKVSHEFLVSVQEDYEHGNNYVYKKIEAPSHNKIEKKLSTVKGKKVSIVLV